MHILLDVFKKKVKLIKKKRIRSNPNERKEIIITVYLIAYIKYIREKENKYTAQSRYFLLTLFIHI